METHDGDRRVGGSSGPADPVALLESATAAVQTIVDRVRPDQLGLPTPCTEWTVRDLINHLDKGNEWAVANLAGGGGAVPRPEGDHLGDDPARAFADSSARMVAAFRVPGALAKMLTLPFGQMPGAAFAGMRAVDTLVHGWDIATAAGQPTNFAPELNEVALAMAKRTLAGRPRAGSPFAPEQPVADDAPAADRLAAFLGRAV